MSYKNKILIVGPSWVGDMMMAQVLFQLLREQNPNAVIDVLAPAWSEALLARMPEIHKSLVLPFGHGQLQLKKRFQFAKKLRAENYSHAFILPNSWKSALIPFWARIPVRTGWRGEYRFGLLNDLRLLDKKKYPTMVERFAALAFPGIALEKNSFKSSCDSVSAEVDTALTLSGELPKDLCSESNNISCLVNKPKLMVQQEIVDRALQKYHLKTDKPILILCPGAEFGPSKCWPAKYYAEVARQKLLKGWQVWLLGSAKDCVITNEIQSLTESKCENLAGKTALSEAVDLLSLAECVVTNDSGLMHIAAALNVNVIAIYGSTSPDFTPPLSDKATILKLNLECQPCFQRVCPLKHHNCMQQLLPEKVLMHLSR